MKPRRLWAGPVLLATALAGGCFARATTARACSLPMCFGEYIAPAQGIRLPGNAPALFQGTFNLETAGPPVLTSASGDTVPTVLGEPGGGRLVQLSSPLPAGMYTLTYETTCAGTAKSVPTEFEVIEASPLPTEVGTVQVGAPTRQTITVAESGQCLAQVVADVITLSIAYSSQLVPFLPVAKHTLMIDGEPWLSTPYGSDEVNVPGAMIRQVSTLYSRPDIGAPYGANYASGISPGHHQGELIVTIAGMAAPLPSVHFEFDFPEPGAPESDDDDASAPSGDVDPALGGGGCSVVSAPQPRSGLALLAFGLSTLVIRARRKRRQP